MPFAIPPLLVVTLGAIGAVAAMRWVMQEARRINAELHPEGRDVRTAGTEAPAVRLRRDPVSGVYRPDTAAGRP